MKLVAQAGTCPPAAAAAIDDYTRSQDVDLQQRCLEFQAILTACPNLLPEILPVDASAEDVDVDPNLSFLDGYVTNALHNGARPYEKPEDDDDASSPPRDALRDLLAACAFFRWSMRHCGIFIARWKLP